MPFCCHIFICCHNTTSPLYKGFLSDVWQHGSKFSKIFFREQISGSSRIISTLYFPLQRHSYLQVWEYSRSIFQYSRSIFQYFRSIFHYSRSIFQYSGLCWNDRHLCINRLCYYSTNRAEIERNSHRAEYFAENSSRLLRAFYIFHQPDGKWTQYFLAKSNYGTTSTQSAGDSCWAFPWKAY